MKGAFTSSLELHCPFLPAQKGAQKGHHDQSSGAPSADSIAATRKKSTAAALIVDIHAHPLQKRHAGLDPASRQDERGTPL